ncbi:UNVERIFIED_CONTAM: hypothetical protein PYX00_001685 [Menopon gallinae]|uniref:Uncharacterized protein n=1 Tax=Menopon gallinae TaxID=328185 RepID=A0AAW2IEE2_9NEOP
MDAKSNLILSGPKKEITGRDEFLGHYVYNSLRKLSPETQFQVIIDTDEKMTFGELFHLGAKVCQGLLNQGFAKGDIVTLAGWNSNSNHAAFLGVLWAGGVAHPVEGDLKFMEMQSILKQVQPKWILCENKALDTILKCANVLDNKPNVIVYNAPREDPNQGWKRFEDILVEVDMNSFAPQPVGSPSDIALILCSSGTTGIPKGVGLTHENVLFNINLWEYIPEIKIREPVLLTSSFSWITGIYFLIMSCYFGSFRVITTSHQPKIIFKAIEDYKLYSAMIPPAVIKCLLDSPEFNNFDKSILKEMYTGGSIMGKPTVERFLNVWPQVKLYQIYGLTEMGGMITMPASKHNPFSVGRIIYNTDVKIVDYETREILGPDQIGEICIRSKGIFKTYIGKEEAVKDVVVDGWVSTGDLGYYSQDKQLFITTRIKEIMKHDNSQISPVELEIYLSSLPGVADAAVAGIDVGEDSFHLMAFIVKIPGMQMAAEDISKKVEENFSECKHLKGGVYFVDSVPRTASGKLKRKELSNMANTFYTKLV